MAIIENILRNKLDKRANKETEKGLERIDDAMAKTGKTAQKASKQVKKANQQAAASGNAVKKSEKDKQAAIKKTTSVLEQQEQAFRSTSERVAAFGDIESGARGAAGIVGVVGGEVGQQIESAVGALAEIPAAIEALPRMAQAIKGVAVRAIAAATGQTALATAETATGTAATGATVGLGAMLIPLGALALIAGGVAAALFLLNKANKSAEEQAKKTGEALEAQIDTQVQLQAALETGDEESAIATFQDLQRQRREAQIKSDQLAVESAQATTDAMEEEARKREAVGPFGQDFAGIGIASIADAIQKTGLEATADDIGERAGNAADELAKLDGILEVAGETLAAYGIDVASIPSGEAAEREKELAATREQSINAIEGLEQQESELRAKRAQAQADLAQDRAIRDRRANEDAAEAGRKRNEQSAKAARDGQKRLANIQREGVKQEIKTRQKASESIIKLNQDTSEKRAKLIEDSDDAIVESQDRFNQRRAEQQRNFENAEFDAIQANDIIGAIKAQRNFEQRKQQESNDFKAEQAQRATEKQERLTALRAEQAERAAETQANLVIELAEQKASLREKVAAEKQAIRERFNAEQKAAAEAEKARTKRLRRQAEDDALRDARSQRAFDEQLQRIEDQKDAEQQALQATFETIQSGGQAAVNAISQANNAAIQATGQIANQVINSMAQTANNAFSGGSASPQAMADGGRIQAGTLAQVNDAVNRRTEFFRPDNSGRIIPLTDNITPNMGRGGGNVTNLSFDLTVGDIATGQMVIDAVTGAARQLGKVNIQAFDDSFAGVG